MMLPGLERFLQTTITVTCTPYVHYSTNHMYHPAVHVTTTLGYDEKLIDWTSEWEIESAAMAVARQRASELCEWWKDVLESELNQIKARFEAL